MAITKTIYFFVVSPFGTLQHKPSRLHQTDIDGPVDFVITEFDCLSEMEI